MRYRIPWGCGRRCAVVPRAAVRRRGAAPQQGATVLALGNCCPPEPGTLARMTIDEAGDSLIDMVVRTANGRATAAEALGHKEFVMTKLYRSA